MNNKHSGAQYPEIPATPIHTALQTLFRGEDSLYGMDTQELFKLAKRMRVTETEWYKEIVNSFTELKAESFMELRKRLCDALAAHTINLVAGDLASIPMLRLRNSVLGAGMNNTDSDADSESDCEECCRPKDECVCSEDDDTATEETDEFATACPGCDEVVCRCEELRCRLCGFVQCICGGSDAGAQGEER